MTLGPLEYTVIGFEGNDFDGSIAREIAKVVENGTIALVDVVFVGRDSQGKAVVLELDNKDDPRFSGFQTLVSGTMGLFTPEDIGEIAGEDDCGCGRMGRYFTIAGRLAQSELRGCSDTHERRIAG